MLAFHELTLTRVQEAKASRKFGVLRSFRYESNRNRRRCLGFSKFRILKKLSRLYTSFSETQAKETWEEDFKRMN